MLLVDPIGEGAVIMTAFAITIRVATGAGEGAWRCGG